MPSLIVNLVLFASLFYFGCSPSPKPPESEQLPPQVTRQLYDSHVHIMSPNLVKSWQDLGIPFSQPDAYYSDLDTILVAVGADKLDLIGMAYVFGSLEFYQGDDELSQVRLENDFLAACAQMHPERVRPFFAVDPLKEYALEELIRCHNLYPQSGVKLHHSASQVYLTEPVHLKKVKTIFDHAANHQLPILLHFDNWHPKFGPPDIALLVDSILADLPPVTLRIAHLGTSGGFNDKTKRFLDVFLDQFAQGNVPDRHRILFDISAVALDKDSEGVSKLTEEEFKELRKYFAKLGYKRLAFGSDYPLYGAVAYQQILLDKLEMHPDSLDLILKNVQWSSP